MSVYRNTPPSPNRFMQIQIGLCRLKMNIFGAERLRGRVVQFGLEGTARPPLLDRR